MLGEELRGLEVPVLHRHVDGQPLLGVERLRGRPAIQHQRAQASVAPLRGDVEGGLHVLVLDLERLPVAIGEQPQALESRVVPSPGRHVQEAVPALPPEAAQPVLHHAHVLQRPGLREHLEHLRPGRVAQELSHAGQLVAPAAGHGACGEEAEEVLGQELHLLAGAVGDAQEHGVAGHHGLLEAGPLAAELAAQQRLCLGGGDAVEAAQGHVERDHLHDLLPPVELLLLVQPVGHLPALHPHQHHVDGHAVDGGDVRALALVLVVVGLAPALGLPLLRLLALHRLQVAQQHAQHHGVPEHLGLAVAALALLSVGLAAPSAPDLGEDALEGIEAAQAEARVRNHADVFLGEALHVHGHDAVLDLFQGRLAPNQRARCDHHHPLLEDLALDAPLDAWLQLPAVLQPLEDEHDVLRLDRTADHEIPVAVLAEGDPQILVEPPVHSALVRAVVLVDHAQLGILGGTLHQVCHRQQQRHHVRVAVQDLHDEPVDQAGLAAAGGAQHQEGARRARGRAPVEPLGDAHDVRPAPPGARGGALLGPGRAGAARGAHGRALAAAPEAEARPQLGEARRGALAHAEPVSREGVDDEAQACAERLLEPLRLLLEHLRREGLGHRGVAQRARLLGPVLLDRAVHLRPERGQVACLLELPGVLGDHAQGVLDALCQLAAVVDGPDLVLGSDVPVADDPVRLAQEGQVKLERHPVARLQVRLSPSAVSHAAHDVLAHEAPDGDAVVHEQLERQRAPPTSTFRNGYRRDVQGLAKRVSTQQRVGHAGAVGEGSGHHGLVGHQPRLQRALHLVLLVQALAGPLHHLVYELLQVHLAEDREALGGQRYKLLQQLHHHSLIGAEPVSNIHALPEALLGAGELHQHLRCDRYRGVLEEACHLELAHVSEERQVHRGGEVDQPKSVRGVDHNVRGVEIPMG
mmetsp:Transcript_90621/g.256168  ORF Transcript_90621/g.256168 Transcript_90621/m.256168 type:complete len:921 (-) Transcript_90621:1368-4130(-)